MTVLLLTHFLQPAYSLRVPKPFPKRGRYSQGILSVPSDSALWRPYKHRHRLPPIPTVFIAPFSLQEPPGTKAQEKNVSIFFKTLNLTRKRCLSTLF